VIARKATISCPNGVSLVTADNELRAVVRRHRPAGMRLACIRPEQASNSPSPSDGELWLDLEGVSAAHLVERAAVCFQTPGAAAKAHLPPAGNAVLVRKPCSASVARRLWRAVASEKARAGPGSAPADRGGGLPAWLNDFHKISLRELCRLCVRCLPQRLGYTDASLYLHDPETGILSLAETTHRRTIDAAVSLTADREHLMAGVARSGRLLRTADARKEWQARSLPVPDRAGYPDGACLIAPLMCEGQLWGLLNMSGRRPAGSRYAKRPGPIFEFLGRSLRYAREYERAHLEARIDVLTGLYNQRWMKEALEKEIRRSERFSIPLSLIAADLDGLKMVNDQEGHLAGDCVLRHVARRIRSVLRQFDSAARVGGDEFTVLLPATALDGARQVARRILESIRTDAALFRGVPLPIRASLGVAEWQPGWDGARLIEVADQAMYTAKKHGRDQLICRDPCTARPNTPPPAPPAHPNPRPEPAALTS
jgi:diguanylate cyclase (GGDEF)-like protein